MHQLQRWLCSLGNYRCPLGLLLPLFVGGVVWDLSRAASPGQLYPEAFFVHQPARLEDLGLELQGASVARRVGAGGKGCRWEGWKQGCGEELAFIFFASRAKKSRFGSAQAMFSLRNTPGLLRGNLQLALPLLGFSPLFLSRFLFQLASLGLVLFPSF